MKQQVIEVIVSNYMTVITRTSCSKRIIPRNKSQHSEEHVLIMESVPVNKFVEVRWEKPSAGSKLSSKFPFRSHPHVFNIFGVDFRIIRIYKKVLVYDHRMHVYPTSDLVNIGVGWPAIGHNM